MSRAPQFQDYRAWRAKHRPRMPLDCEVSFVVISLNAEETVEETLQSLVVVKRPQDEIILIDGGSIDRTLSLVANFSRDIDLLISESDHGIYDAMNRGIVLAAGQVIKIISADDRIRATDLGRIVSLLSSECAVVWGEVAVVTRRGEYVKSLGVTSRDSSSMGPVLHPSWYVSRRVYEEFGLYRTDFSVSADFEMRARLLTAGVPFIEVEGPLIDFRAGGTSQALTGVKERFLIVRAYQGFISAVSTGSRHGGQKLRSNALRFVLGEDRFERLRSALHSARSGR